MKVNPTVALTLVLLALMGGAGIVSAGWGYALGREALKGVTQPDVRPATAGSEDAQSQPRHQEMMIVPEAKILEEVKGRISGSGANAQPGNAQSSTVQPPQPESWVPPSGQPNAAQPVSQPVELAPMADPMGGFPSGNLPPANPGPNEQRPEIPVDGVQPGSFPPDGSLPDGFNQPAVTEHTVGFRFRQLGSERLIASSISDRPATTQGTVNVVKTGYGVERLGSTSPFNLCG